MLLVWVPIRWRKPGLSLYAIGSSRNASFLAGISVAKTRIGAYALGSAFAAMGGLALTATSGIGDALSGQYYTLNSVAAVVLGGVALVGGVGGLIGPIAAAFVLTLVKSIMILKGVDQNWAQVIQGTLIVLVVMIGGLALRQRSAMSSAPQAAEPSSARFDPRRLFADNPVAVLTLVFVGLFVATDIVNRVQSSEAFLTPKQVSTTFLYAAILGLMAAGQTLVMLTGGVDLSVATTATTGVHDLQLPDRRGREGDRDRASRRAGDRDRERDRRRDLPRQSADHDAGGEYGHARRADDLQPDALPLAGARPRHEARLGTLLHLRSVRPARLGADLGADHPRPPLQRLRPDDLRGRRQRNGVPARRRADVAGAARRLRALRALSAAAGILLVGFNDAADLGIATPFLLPSVAAVVIGGTSIFGGVGGYAGTILGALILTVLDSLLTILNASQAVRQMLYGLIILALAAIYARAASAD